jgi:hypothetical protein
MRRKSPTPTVDALCLLDALGLHFSALVIDNDEVKADSLKKPRELLHPCALRGVFSLRDDGVRHARARREFTLAQVGHGTRSPKVPICRKTAHEAKRRRMSSTLAPQWGTWDLPIALVDKPSDHSRDRFALFPYGNSSALFP